MIKHNVFYLIISFILVNFQGFSRDLPEFDKFYSILIQLESGGKTNAIGDKGLAIGEAQIHKAYFLDAQQFNKNLSKYSYSNCFESSVSKLVVKSYLLRYSKSNDWGEWARIHNSGPNWRNKKELTNNYWIRFQKIAKKLN